MLVQNESRARIGESTLLQGPSDVDGSFVVVKGHPHISLFLPFWWFLMR